MIPSLCRNHNQCPLDIFVNRFSVFPIPSFLDNSSLELGVTFRLRDAKNPVASICADMPVAAAAMSNICADMHVAAAPCARMWRLL